MDEESVSLLWGHSASLILRKLRRCVRPSPAHPNTMCNTDLVLIVLLTDSGWAHVALHDAVLDGNIVLVKGTLLRYIRKCPAKINEHDVSTGTTTTARTIASIRYHSRCHKQVIPSGWVRLVTFLAKLMRYRIDADTFLRVRAASATTFRRRVQPMLMMMCPKPCSGCFPTCQDRHQDKLPGLQSKARLLYTGNVQ